MVFYCRRGGLVTQGTTNLGSSSKNRLIDEINAGDEQPDLKEHQDIDDVRIDLR